jgi:4-hydroxy-tetrahydrodipicolinate reductase
MELTGRADPRLDTAVADVLDAADVLVDFTQPDVALENALAALAAGVHVVIGTTGFDPAPHTVSPMRPAAPATATRITPLPPRPARG